MNIFVLDLDPKLAARYHCDKHVVKMITESAQLLCSSYYLFEDQTPPYKLSHWNHPCAKWVRLSRDNWDWLLALGLNLYIEYRHRYGADHPHKAGEVLVWLAHNPPPLERSGMTPFPLCMPEDCKGEYTVDSYRLYYVRYKINILDYSRREKPPWLEGLIQYEYSK